ncbi:transcription factor DUO1-like [Impatiens glandulifera]|uniref:transcription factor DUO1-like n=1 Tax=Impatiens glandulifera TaxID=253017 RepID=UPI001FB0DCCF|nr:transcription factor DUO1-like [Impatiens glandulifera]
MSRDYSRRQRCNQRIQFVGDEEEEIKKGPWKEEEDQVLISHVHKYGPRDWSSIRSKGLLRRTGKSCRLRWVNKLRPDLKSGVKFSTEEERMVIELQSQIGNKWARIATQLPGRTDNDVKNFWSSRQKRLTRLLHNTNLPESSNSQTIYQEGEASDHPATNPEVHQILNSSVNIFDNNPEMMMMNMLPFSLPLPDLSTQADLFNAQHVVLEMPLPLQMIPDPCFCLENLEDVFGHGNGNVGGNGLVDNMSSLPILEPPCFSSLDGNCQGSNSNGERGRSDEMNECCPEITGEDIFDDFPPDMFDHIETLPSPSKW